MTARFGRSEKCSLLGFARLPLWIESMDPEQVFRTESELFWGERRMFLCQNRTPIVETAMNSAGGSGESFGDLRASPSSGSVESEAVSRANCSLLRTGS